MQPESKSTIRPDGESFRASHPSVQELTNFAAGCEQDMTIVHAIELHLETCAACLERVTSVEPDAFQSRIKRLAGADTTTTPAVRLTSGYELLEEIGRGGAGIVYRARQLGLNREVAYKTLLSGASSSAQQLTRFRHESLALGRIDHPHIVKIFDVGEQNGAPYLAMELVPGSTLSELLRARPMEITAAVQLVRHLADAIQSAHEQGVLHRDLKPQNILLHDADPRRPKIADFGLSHLCQDAESVTRTGDPLGTPSYMAPEQVVGDKQLLTSACDVYGLGAILYECIAGRPPFRGATVIETMDMVLRQDPVLLRQVRPGVPEDLETICHRALEKEPARRYPSAAALRDDLAAFQERRPIVARPRSRAYRASLWVRRNPWPAAWFSTVLAALLAGFVFLVAYQYRLAEQRDRASQQYAVARSAIWSMIDVAGQRNSFQVPMLSELTLEQARHALRLFEDLAKEDPSREAELDLAKVRMHTGTLLLALGQTTEGEALLSLASQRLNEIVDVSTVVPDELRTLVVSQGKLAVALISQDRLDEARRILEPAIELAKRFQTSQPKNTSLMNSVGWLYDHLATLEFHANRIREMKEAITQAIGYYQRALKSNPENSELAVSLAESRVNLAQAESQRTRIQERDCCPRIHDFARKTDSSNPGFFGHRPPQPQ
jgi:eukaryotic-like serine/threonine-protein kinase